MLLLRACTKGWPVRSAKPAPPTWHRLPLPPRQKRALDRNRLSHTERLLQSTQAVVKESEEKKGACGAEGGGQCQDEPSRHSGRAWAPRLHLCCVCSMCPLAPPRAPVAVLKYFEDSRVAMWLVFSDVWNACVEELRAVDLISDAERDNLVFVHLDIDPSIQARRAGPL